MINFNPYTVIIDKNRVYRTKNISFSFKGESGKTLLEIRDKYTGNDNRLKNLFDQCFIEDNTPHQIEENFLKFINFARGVLKKDVLANMLEDIKNSNGIKMDKNSSTYFIQIEKALKEN